MLSRIEGWRWDYHLSSNSLINPQVNGGLSMEMLEPLHPAAVQRRVGLNHIFLYFIHTKVRLEDGKLVWPVLFLYPEKGETDFIEEFRWFCAGNWHFLAFLVCPASISNFLNVLGKFAPHSSAAIHMGWCQGLFLGHIRLFTCLGATNKCIFFENGLMSTGRRSSSFSIWKRCLGRELKDPGGILRADSHLTLYNSSLKISPRS